MSLRNSVTEESPAALEQHTGVITRIVNYKFGFLSSEGHENIFFHFSELSDDAKACVEPGCSATFFVRTNQWSADNKMKAVQLQIISSPEQNAFKNLEGVIQSDMRTRGFTFIDCADAATYLFHSTNLVNDDASKAAGNTVKEGHKVLFDAEFNHKYNPPKPFATNVRIVPGQTELNAAAAALEMQSPENTTWQRGSRLGLTGSMSPEDADKLDYDELTISPPALTRNSSVRDRASALKAGAPARRWSRTNPNPNTEKQSDKPSGGINMLNNTCKFGTRCTNATCWFEHPNGRAMDGNATLSDADESSDESAKTSSMGKASLRLLVKAIVADTSKQGYLHIRNTLQKSEYVGRALTREEKASVGDILENLDTPEKVSPPASTEKPYTRGTSRLSLSRGTSTGRSSRVSLADMCKDPSLHSRLSMRNSGTPCA